MGELKILAIGDSITAGAVPSRNANHPYTIQLKNILQSKYPSLNIAIDNQGKQLRRWVPEGQATEARRQFRHRRLVAHKGAPHVLHCTAAAAAAEES
jgi:hypothetical protein